MKKHQNQTNEQRNIYDQSIAPRFNEIANDLLLDGGKYTHYLVKGGRSSCKSSFIALTIILMMSAENEDGTPFLPGCHGVALRRYTTYLAGSVYNRLKWSITSLQQDDAWLKYKSPPALVHKKSGNKIIFIGGDEPHLLKSINPATGYFRFIWFEEFSEFACEEDIRIILQSLMRGGSKFTVFYSYNPPKSVQSWVNVYAMEMQKRKDFYIHHSTFRTVAREWIGEPALIEAAELKEKKPISYQHEYLGRETGSGGQVFDNLVERLIADEEISHFANIHTGLDFGYAIDPTCYLVMNYEKALKRLYIFGEFYKQAAKYEVIAEAINALHPRYGTVTADSAEPRSIAELQDRGISILGAKKGPGSVEHGIKWLQELYEIIIDPARCPNTAREFRNYELKRDKHGNFRADFPAEDNHSIDATRYSCEDLMHEKAIYKPVAVGGYTNWNNWRQR